MTQTQWQHQTGTNVYLKQLEKHYNFINCNFKGRHDFSEGFIGFLKRAFSWVTTICNPPLWMWESEISLHLSFIGLNPTLMTKYKKQPFISALRCVELWGCWTAQRHRPLHYCRSWSQQTCKSKMTMWLRNTGEWETILSMERAAIVYLWERNDALSSDFQGLSENVLDREQGRKEEKEKEWGKVLKE